MAQPAVEPFDVQKARDQAIRMLRDIVQSEDMYPVAERRQAAKALLDALGEMPNAGAELLVLDLSDEQLVDIIARELKREALPTTDPLADVPRGTPPAPAPGIVPAGTTTSPTPAAAAPVAPRPTLAALLAGVGDFGDPLADEADPLA